MNDAISIQKDSLAGQALCDGAVYIGIDPEDLLMGICLNSMKRKRNPLLPRAAANTRPQERPQPATPPRPAPAGSSGLFDGAA